MNTTLTWITTIAALLGALGVLKIWAFDLRALHKAVEPIPAMQKELVELRREMKLVRGAMGGFPVEESKPPTKHKLELSRMLSEQLRRVGLEE